MHIHILGICGTFMGSLAVLAKQLGHRVTGSDANVYPPMSTQLEQQGIELEQGYNDRFLAAEPDLVIVGNAMSRGNPAVESLLNSTVAYCSGPEWLSREVLQGRWVIALSGTHGKTTTTTMVLSILEYANMAPGYLVGGVPKTGAPSASLGDSPFFVIEADEYDSAFFDKRSKFVHYRPRTLVINNLEFDHADIFNSLADIQRQFHHVIRTVPSLGRVCYPTNVESIDEVIEMGCYSEQATMGSYGVDGAEWQVNPLQSDCAKFEVFHKGQLQGEVSWLQTGRHNMANALSAIVASHHVGVTAAIAIEALNQFAGVKRRMELLLDNDRVAIIDDFAHHPTAIALTLQGARASVGNEATLLAVIEPRSNTMRMGVHRAALIDSVKDASEAIWYQPSDSEWQLDSLVAKMSCKASVEHSIDDLEQAIIDRIDASDTKVYVIIMSNGGFGSIHHRLVERLS